MKIIGRSILGITGVLMAVRGIPNLIQSINSLNGINWTITWALNDPSLNLLMTFIGAILFLIAALSALIGCIAGRKSFKLALSAIILIIPVVIALVGVIQAGTPFSWQLFWDFLGGFALPIAYFIGFLLV